MNSTILFTEQDPEGRSITLTTERWTHIQKGHPEIGQLQKVKSIVRKPDLIIDQTSRKSLIYSKYSTNISESNRVNVIAKMDDNYATGDVKTAYITRSDLKGDIIWVRNSI